jgi:hypothetical protein
VLRHYEKFYKNSVDASRSMCGGTLISVADCFRMQQQMFMRDSSAEGQVKDAWKLAINRIHSGGTCVSENIITGNEIIIWLYIERDMYV